MHQMSRIETHTASALGARRKILVRSSWPLGISCLSSFYWSPSGLLASRFRPGSWDQGKQGPMKTDQSRSRWCLFKLKSFNHQTTREWTQNYFSASITEQQGKVVRQSSLAPRTDQSTESNKMPQSFNWSILLDHGRDLFIFKPSFPGITNAEEKPTFKDTQRVHLPQLQCSPDRCAVDPSNPSKGRQSNHALTGVAWKAKNVWLRGDFCFIAQRKPKALTGTMVASARQPTSRP